MLIEQRIVSRKTPLDGRLEISESTVAQLAPLGETFRVRTAQGEGEARLHAMACTCAKSGTTGQHVHHFVESDVLRALEPGASVRLELDGAPPGSLAVR
ncbi:MAG: hypothetical protein ABI889_12715 [Gemmatimonadota bacterium]